MGSPAWPGAAEGANLIRGGQESARGFCWLFSVPDKQRWGSGEDPWRILLTTRRLQFSDALNNTFLCNVFTS